MSEEFPPLRIALLQLLAHQNDQSANLTKGIAYCLKAKKMGADIALFPEMWNIGYTPFEQPDLVSWQAQAIAADSEFVQRYCALAKELNMAIAITYLEKIPNAAPRNVVSLIDRFGNIQFTYAKVHTCDFSMEGACTPGDDFYVCDLDTEKGVVKVGAMICYDREFPESARILMLKGAEIILTPNASTMGENRLCQFKTRAFENMVGVALANYAYPQQDGHSCAFDGIAFDGEGISRDTCLVLAEKSEGIYVVDFSLRDLREWRHCETWGNAYRKPKQYQLLVSTEIEPPFLRGDAKR